MDKLKPSGNYTIENSIGDTINKYYESNSKNFDTIENIIYKDFEIPKGIIRDHIKYLLSVDIENDSKNFNKKFIYLHEYNKVKMFFYYFVAMFYFLYFSVFGLRKKKEIKIDILFEEGYESFYRIIYTKLKQFKLGVLNFGNRNKSNNFYDSSTQQFYTESLQNFLKDISWKIFSKQFFKFFQYNKLSKDLDLNCVLLVLRIFKHIATFKTDLNGVNTKVLLSANSNAYTSLKYYIYKKQIKNILIIENGVVVSKSARCDGEWFTYCDTFFGMGKNNKENIGMVCSDFQYVGSVLLANSIYELDIDNQKFDKEFDIVFMEQYIVEDTDTHKIDYYFTALNYLAIFSKKFPQYKIGYRVRASRELEKHESIQKYIEKYDKIINDSNIILDDKISKNSYESMLKSEIVIFYSSSIGVEALALDKKVLCVNFDKKHFCRFTEEESIGMLYEKNYDLFEAKLLYLLDGDFKEKITYFRNLKSQYIEQKENLIDDMVEYIKNEVI